MDGFGILNLLTRFFDFYLKNKGGDGDSEQSHRGKNDGFGYGNEGGRYNDCGCDGNGERGGNGRHDGFCNDGDCGNSGKKDDPLSNLFNIINESKSDGGRDGEGSSGFGGFGGGGLFGNLAGGLQKLLSGLSKFGNFGGCGTDNRQAPFSSQPYGNACVALEGGKTKGSAPPPKSSPAPPNGDSARQTNNRQPLQAAMLATMSAHDNFIKRVKEKHGV